MTLSARLEDLEVTLEHMLMDVFVSFSTVSLAQNCFNISLKNALIYPSSLCFIWVTSPAHNFSWRWGLTYVHATFQMLCS